MLHLWRFLDFRSNSGRVWILEYCAPSSIPEDGGNAPHRHNETEVEEVACFRTVNHVTDVS